MRFRLVLVLILVGLAVLARLCLFSVDRTEFVYLTQFGRHVATYDGADPGQAGLHFQWPWPVESVQSLDRRLQYFDLPGAELLTRDPRGNTIDKTLTIDAYVCWRIADADGVDRFLRSVGTPAGAQAILGQRINSQLGAAIGQRELDDLISTAADEAVAANGAGLIVGTWPALAPAQAGPAAAVPPVALLGAADAAVQASRRVDAARRQLRERLLDEAPPGGQSLRAAARQEYGIEVVDVRLRRFNHPPAVRDAIFERIRSERQKKVADYQSEGERQAADIRSAGERRAAELKAEAEAEVVRLRGQADADADRIRNEAARLDPQFYAFLKKLEDYRRILGDNKSVLLLSTHREIFDALFHPPNPGAPNGSPPVSTSKRGGS
jgi:membrane protease subunit HflC